MTNKQFVDKVIEELQLYTKDMQENVIFKKKTDEERMQEEIDAAKEQQIEQAITEGVGDAGQ